MTLHPARSGMRRTSLSFQCRDIARFLKVRRLRMGIEQASLAGQIGTSAGHLRNLESGRYSANLATLIRWTGALDCSVLVVEG